MHHGRVPRFQPTDEGDGVCVPAVVERDGEQATTGAVDPALRRPADRPMSRDDALRMRGARDRPDP